MSTAALVAALIALAAAVMSAHTQQIRAVILRGRHFDRQALDALLAGSAAMARVN